MSCALIGWITMSEAAEQRRIIDIQFICSEYYNKKEYLRFDSNVGRFVGYTDLGVKNAERLNKDQSQIAAFMAQRETVCQPNIDINYQVVLTKTGEFSDWSRIWEGE
uniref:MHC class II beta chain N-terminal domain-containing protein n=1 Tax=Cyprinodon variegatus TaxID=28743 RepID=A0A3Q2CP14_CYPVA